MSFFKRIFGRLFGGKKKSTAKAQGGECWYNNAHERKVSRWQTPTASGVPWSDNSVDNAETMKMSKD